MHDLTHQTPFKSDLISGLAHETPYFLFSKNIVRENIRQFREHFVGSSIFFAMKANGEPEILKTVFDEGAGFEVASIYELSMLKEIGVPPQKIIYGTSVKPIDQIKKAYQYGIRIFALDSLPELEKIAAAAPGSKVFVRVSVNDAGSVFKFSEKFGTEVENVAPFLEEAKRLGLYPYGISFHVGSQASNPEAWANAIERINPQIEKLQKKGITIEMIDLGGGYPCRYHEDVPSIKEIAENTRGAYKKLNHKPKYFLEPGRGIVANSAVLVATIIARVERKGNTWLFLDAGVYNGLFETMAYQGSTRYPITSLRTSFDSGEKLFAIAGPTGDSPDILTREALLPRDIAVGEKVVIHNVGAYSTVLTSRFNGFPKPAIHFID